MAPRQLEWQTPDSESERSRRAGRLRSPAARGALQGDSESGLGAWFEITRSSVAVRSDSRPSESESDVVAVVPWQQSRRLVVLEYSG